MGHYGSVIPPAGVVDRIRILPAQIRHIDAIGRLTVAAYHAGGHLTPGSPYEQVLRDVGPRVHDTLIATVDDELLGSISVLAHDHTMSELAGDGEWEVRFLAVRSDTWGSGVARALMDAGEQRARDHGAQSTVLYVIDRNTRALAFYPRRGYARIPDRDWSPQGTDGSPVHLLAFAKALGTAPSVLPTS